MLRQAGAELGQAQLKLRLDLTPSLIVLAEQTIFPIYTIPIQIQIAELTIASYS